MLFQILLTVIIVACALGIAIYRTVRYLQNPIRGCDGCDKNCGGCSLEDLKREIDEKKKEKDGN
ncbi:MAG: hypothetical protein NTW10_10160 [Bacteroidetes bacterium]|nr:hypothetical protein [Bacteroidota bacterium]